MINHFRKLLRRLPVRSLGTTPSREKMITRYPKAYPELAPPIFMASRLLDGSPPIHPDVSVGRLTIATYASIAFQLGCLSAIRWTDSLAHLPHDNYICFWFQDMPPLIFQPTVTIQLLCSSSLNREVFWQPK
jgi:hypothetical protein